MSFGKRLKKLREARRFSIEDLAQQCNVEPLVIEKVESNQSNPSIFFIQTISRMFNVSTDYLLGMTDEKDRIMTIVHSGKSVGDVVIQMLTEMGIVYTDANDEYQLVDAGVLLSKKERRIIDMVRRQNYSRSILSEAEKFGCDLEEYAQSSTNKQDDILNMIKFWVNPIYN